MTVTEPPASQDPASPETPQPKPGNEENIRKLREQAEAGQSAQRELAMVKAGIDTESPMGKFFAENYKGELNKEAVIGAAIEVGLLEKPEPTTAPVSDQERQATEERQRLASGAADGGTQPTKHPRTAALDKAKEVLKEGATYEQAGAAYLSVLMQAYQEGDERATRKPGERE